jgi:hypothetical protein
MGTACSAERRAFLKTLTTTTAALAIASCGGATDSGSTSAAGAPPGANPPAPNPPAPNPNPPAPPGTNLPPVWQTVTTIAFTQGVASSVYIGTYVSDPNGDLLTITKNAVALPAGVTYDQATKSFVYNGTGAVASTTGHILTANDGQP